MDPEMMRLLEILRPLWPGLVIVDSGKNWLTICGGQVRLEVLPDGASWRSMVYVRNEGVLCHNWSNPEEAAPILQNQAKRARERTEALMGAFGWEVADA